MLLCRYSDDVACRLFIRRYYALHLKGTNTGTQSTTDHFASIPDLWPEGSTGDESLQLNILYVLISVPSTVAFPWDGWMTCSWLPGLDFMRVCNTHIESKRVHV